MQDETRAARRGAHDHDGDHAPAVDPRVVFAAERTLLAWVRTSLAMLGLGFLLARFGLLGPDPPGVTGVGRIDVSEAAGILLIGAGVLINVVAAAGHVRFMRRYLRGAVVLPGPVSMAVALAIGAAIVGAALVWYLLDIG
jgi:putative membrane protein